MDRRRLFGLSLFDGWMDGWMDERAADGGFLWRRNSGAVSRRRMMRTMMMMMMMVMVECMCVFFLPGSDPC